MTYTVVACFVCSDAVLLSTKTYIDIMKDINEYNTGEVLFRTTVCNKCEAKIKKVRTSYINLPEQNTKIPIGTTLVVGWTVYRNISLFMRKYCRIYNFDDTHMHVLENKNDILKDTNRRTTIHKFNYDAILHLDAEEAHEFFYEVTSLDDYMLEG